MQSCSCPDTEHLVRTSAQLHIKIYTLVMANSGKVSFLVIIFGHDKVQFSSKIS